MPKSGAPGSSLRTFRVAITLGAASKVLPHPLEDAAAMLVTVFCNWNAGHPYITAQDEDTITIAFPSECSITTGEIVYTVSL